MSVQKYKSLNINFLALGVGVAFAALFRFATFPSADEPSIRDDSGGGECRGRVKTGGDGSGRSGAVGAIEARLVGSGSGIVDALVILGTPGALGVAVDARVLLGIEHQAVFR